MQEVFGPLAGAPALCVMEIPDRWGSQVSLASGIIQEAATLRERDPMPQSYHELMHLWNAPDLDNPIPRWKDWQCFYRTVWQANRTIGMGESSKTPKLTNQVIG